MKKMETNFHEQRLFKSDFSLKTAKKTYDKDKSIKKMETNFHEQRLFKFDFSLKTA